MATKLNKFSVEYAFHDENDNTVDAWQIGPQVTGLIAEARAKDLRWAHIILPVVYDDQNLLVAVLTRSIAEGHYGFTLVSVAYDGAEQLARARQALTRHIRYKWCPSHGLVWQQPLKLPEIRKCLSIVLNAHELWVDLLLYDADSLSVQDASKVYDQGELVGEFGPFECDGFHARSMYQGVNRAIELARRILETEIDQTAREQVCRIDHENYGNHRLIKSRVFKLENGLIGWELAIGDDVRMGAETCGSENPENWKRIARTAAIGWREAVLEQLEEFVIK